MDTKPYRFQRRATGWSVITVSGACMTAVLLFSIMMAAGASFASPHVSAIEQGLQQWRAGNHGEAVALWLPQAQAGEAEAALFVGFAYRTGRGVDVNVLEAARWYKIAAEKGMPEAQLELSLMYELGLGVPVDAEEAAGWASLATRGEFCPADLPAGGRLGDR